MYFCFHQPISDARSQLSLDFAHSDGTTNSLNENDVREIFFRVYAHYQQRMKKERSFSDIRILFYPYRSLKAVMRVKGTAVEIRISRYAAGQGAEYFEALAHCLWSDLLKMKAPSGVNEKFEKLQQQLFVTLKANGQWLPVKKRIIRMNVYHNLTAILSEISRTYFHRVFPELTIGWSSIAAKRRLGYYDPQSRTIVISKILDNPDVPSYVIKYLVYHEHLHHLLPAEYRSRNKSYHGAYFKKQEQKFSSYNRAIHWLKHTYPLFLDKQQIKQRKRKNN